MLKVLKKSIYKRVNYILFLLKKCSKIYLSTKEYTKNDLMSLKNERKYKKSNFQRNKNG